MTRRYETAAQYLESYGLDPQRIVAQGFDESGYDEFTTIPPTIGGDGPHPPFKTRRRSWPEGFDVDELLRRMAE